MDFESFIPLLKNYLALYGLKVVAAIVVFILGRWAAMVVRGITRKLLTRASVDQTIVSFAVNLVYFVMLIFVVLRRASSAQHTDDKLYRHHRRRRACRCLVSSKLSVELCRGFPDDNVSPLQGRRLYRGRGSDRHRFGDADIYDQV